MPIEIFELVVKAKIDESNQQSGDNERDTRYMECRDRNREKNAAIAQQTSEILNRRKER